MAVQIAAGSSADALRARAAADPRAAIKEAAKQFEAMFMQEVMKSMRQATLASGMLDNAASQLGTEMLDTQFASQLAGQRGGLSELIARQLERQMGGPAPKPVAQTATTQGAATAARPPGFSEVNGQQRQLDFLRAHGAAARAAEAETGLPAAFVLAQAAHESGWGQREIRHADGTSANNLFGIKAGAGWKGAVAETVTTEFVDGQPRKLTQRFRAYATPEESFRDFARLMKDSGRYGAVLASGRSAEQYAQGLQAAGYATDPDYAGKLGRVINTTLRLQRALG